MQRRIQIDDDEKEDVPNAQMTLFPATMGFIGALFV